MKSFGKYAAYYELFNKDKQYASEVDYVHHLIQKYAPNAKNILELGCGTGLHAEMLGEKGYSIHGVDLSEQMLTIAKNRLTKKHEKSSLEFTCGDIRSIRINHHFDAIISLFHVMSYQITNRDLEATFQTVRAHLKKNGIFIFDCWYGPAVLHLQPSTRVKEFQDDQFEVKRIAIPIIRSDENVVDVNYTISVHEKMKGKWEEFKELHRMRYLFPSEIETLFSRFGFSQLKCSEWLTDKEPSQNTWGVCFVGRYQ